ncbi:unnamed protein product, partial [marine sediment metagenome]
MKLTRGKINKIRKAKKQSVIKGGKVKRRRQRNKTFRRKGGSNIRYKSIRRKSPKRRYRGGENALPCPAADIANVDTLGCKRSNALKLYPDKNLGCQEEASAKFQQWNNRCQSVREKESEMKRAQVAGPGQSQVAQAPQQVEVAQEFQAPQQPSQTQMSAEAIVPFSEPTQQSAVVQAPMPQQSAVVQQPQMPQQSAIVQQPQMPQQSAVVQASMPQQS